MAVRKPREHSPPFDGDPPDVAALVDVTPELAVDADPDPVAMQHAPGWAFHPYGNPPEQAAAELDPLAAAVIHDAAGLKLVRWLEEAVAYAEQRQADLLAAVILGKPYNETVAPLLDLHLDLPRWRRILAFHRNPFPADPPEVTVDRVQLFADVLASGNRGLKAGFARLRQKIQSTIADAGREIERVVEILRDPQKFVYAVHPPGDRLVVRDALLAQLKKEYPLLRGATWQGDFNDRRIPWQGAYDCVHNRISTALRTKREETERLAVLDALEQELDAKAAAAVGRALETQKGPDQAGERLTDAMLLDSAIQPGLEAAKAEFDVSLAKLKAIRDQLDTLSLRGQGGSEVAEGLHHEHAAEEARMVEMRGRWVAATTEHAQTIVRQAMAGDEAARAELERIARRSSKSLLSPAGFVAQLEQASFDSVTLRAFGEELAR